MVEAVERNGVAFNMGTNRRWDHGYDAGGARVPMPLESHPLTLRRDRAPRQPTYEPLGS